MRIIKEKEHEAELDKRIEAKMAIDEIIQEIAEKDLLKDEPAEKADLIIDMLNDLKQEKKEFKEIEVLLQNQSALNNIVSNQNMAHSFLLKEFDINKRNHHMTTRALKDFKKVLFGSITITALAFYVVGSKHKDIRPYLGKVVEWGFKAKE